MKELRGKVSGLCQPEYVLDIPGGYGKVPLGTEWATETDPGSYAVSDHQQTTHRYTD